MTVHLLNQIIERGVKVVVTAVNKPYSASGAARQSCIDSIGLYG